MYGESFINSDYITWIWLAKLLGILLFSTGEGNEPLSQLQRCHRHAIIFPKTFRVKLHIIQHVPNANVLLRNTS